MPAPREAWQSSSTGHQLSSHRPDAASRRSRVDRLNSQLRCLQLAPTPRRPSGSVLQMLRQPGLMRQAPGPSLVKDPQPPLADTSRALFDGVVAYVNGSTYPLVSDHRLRQLLVRNGARVSLQLERRKVTHVILGRPAGSSRQGAAGGGLAARKLDKEIRRTAGCAVEFVDANWYTSPLSSPSAPPALSHFSSFSSSSLSICARRID